MFREMTMEKCTRIKIRKRATKSEAEEGKNEKQEIRERPSLIYPFVWSVAWRRDAWLKTACIYVSSAAWDRTEIEIKTREKRLCVVHTSVAFPFRMSFSENHHETSRRRCLSSGCKRDQRLSSDTINIFSRQRRRRLFYRLIKLAKSLSFWENLCLSA